MGETIGKCACPICGIPADVRVNKNFNLYTMCENSHQTRLSAFDSRKMRAALARGETYTLGRNIFQPLEQERKQENDGNNGNNDRIGNTTGNNGQLPGNDKPDAGDSWDVGCL